MLRSRLKSRSRRAKKIVELTQQDSILLTIFGCGLVDLVAPTTMTLVPAARSDRTHLPGCRSLWGCPMRSDRSPGTEHPGLGHVVSSGAGAPSRSERMGCAQRCDGRTGDRTDDGNDQ